MLYWIEIECKLIVNTLVACGRQTILSWCEGAHHLNTSYKAGWFFQSFQFWLAHVSCSLGFLLLVVYWLIIFYTKLCSWCVVHQIQTELIFFLNGTISKSNISYVVCVQLWIKCVVYGILISLNSVFMYTRTFDSSLYFSYVIMTHAGSTTYYHYSIRGDFSEWL